MLPPTSSSLPPPLLRLRLQVTRLLQCSEAFGFDGLARLLLFGAHDVGLLERGLYGTAKESVPDESSNWQSHGKCKWIGKARDSFTCLAGAMIVKDLLWYGSFQWVVESEMIDLANGEADEVRM